MHRVRPIRSWKRRQWSWARDHPRWAAPDCSWNPCCPLREFFLGVRQLRRLAFAGTDSVQESAPDLQGGVSAAKEPAAGVEGGASAAREFAADPESGAPAAKESAAHLGGDASLVKESVADVDGDAPAVKESMADVDGGVCRQRGNPTAPHRAEPPASESPSLLTPPAVPFTSAASNLL
jgi:hypothetical protein